MKKHLILLFIVSLFTFSSCSNDDDATEENTVLGTWNLVEMSPDVVGLDDCPDKPVIIFEDNGDIQWTFYDSDNNCQASTDSGKWENSSGTEYTLNIPGYDPFVGTVNFDSAEKFTFSTSYQVDASTSFPVQFTFAK
jgi:hypothetical protein